MQGKEEHDYGDLSLIHSEIMRQRQHNGAAAALECCMYWRQHYPRSFQILLFVVQYTYELGEYEKVWPLLAELEMLRPGSVEANEYRMLCAKAMADTQNMPEQDMLPTENMGIVGVTQENPSLSLGQGAQERVRAGVTNDIDVTRDDSLHNPFLQARSQTVPTVTSESTIPKTVDTQALDGVDEADGGATMPISAPSFVARLGQIIQNGEKQAYSSDNTVPVTRASSQQLREEELRWMQERGQLSSSPAQLEESFDSLSTNDYRALDYNSSAISLPYARPPKGVLATIVENEGEDARKFPSRRLFSPKAVLTLLLFTCLSYLLMFFAILPSSWEKRAMLPAVESLVQASAFANRGDANSIKQSLLLLNRVEHTIKYRKFYNLIKPLVVRDRIAEIYKEAEERRIWLQAVLSYQHEVSQVTSPAANLPRPRIQLATMLNTIERCERLTPHKNLAQEGEYREQCFKKLESEMERFRPSLTFYADYWILRAVVDIELRQTEAAKIALRKSRSCLEPKLATDFFELRVLLDIGSNYEDSKDKDDASTLSSLIVDFETLRYRAYTNEVLVQGDFVKIQESASPKMKSQILFWRAANGLLDLSDSEILALLESSMLSDSSNCDAAALQAMMQFFNRAVELERTSFQYHSLCRGSTAAVFIDSLNILAQGRDPNELQLHELASVDPMAALFLSVYLSINADFESPARILQNIKKTSANSPLQRVVHRVYVILTYPNMPSDSDRERQAWLSAVAMWSTLMQRPLAQILRTNKDFINQLIQLTPDCERALRCFASLQNNPASTYSSVTSMCRDANPDVSARARLCHTLALTQARERVHDLNTIIRIGEDSMMSSPRLLRSLLTAYFSFEQNDEAINAKIDTKIKRWEDLGFDDNELNYWKGRSQINKGESPIALNKLVLEELPAMLELQARELLINNSEAGQQTSHCDKFIRSSINEDQDINDPEVLAQRGILRMNCYHILGERAGAARAALQAAQSLRAIPKNSTLQRKYSRSQR
ncbi:MAG: hypothetical protein WC966_03710 [Bradymonadales bacterium]|jgi:hypothetical protein